MSEEVVNTEVSAEQTTEMGTQWISPDGAFADAGSLPESIRDTVAGNGWKSVDDIVNSYSNLRKQFSSGERIPEDITEEEKSAIMAKISGRPETADAYDFGERDVDESFKGKVQELAYNLGLGSEQVNSLLDLQNEYMDTVFNSSRESISKMQEENMAKLRSTMGNKKVEDIQNKVGKLFDSPELSNIINSEGFDKNPSFLLLMGKVLDGMGEGSVPTTENTAPKSREDVMAEIRRNPAFTDRMHPDHQDVIRQFHELYGIR